MSSENKFAKLGIIYAVGQILSKLISFILLPIYTKELGMVGFGELALTEAVLDVITTFAIIGIHAGYIRFYREYDETHRGLLKNTAVNFSLFISCIHIFFILIFGKLIANVIFDFNNSYYILNLIMLRSIITQLVVLLMCDYSLNYKAKINVTLNLANLLMNLLLTIGLVVYFKRGIRGIYEGYIISNILTLAYLIYKDDIKYRLELDMNMLKNMLKFSAGLIPSCLASSVLTLSDRYFLKGYTDYKETGIYSVGYKFGMLIEPVFVTPFKQIFTPYKFEIWKNEDAEEQFNLMFEKYHIIGCFIMLGICIYSKAIIAFLTPNETIVAYKIVPLIVLSYFLYGKSCFYCLGIEIKNKTYYDGLIMLSGGIINIILNILLIPSLGMYGAALATVISYTIMNGIYLKFSLPLYHVRYKKKKIFKLYIITFLIYCVYFFVSCLDVSIIFEMFIGIILLIMYIGFCICFKVINKQELEKIYMPYLQKINLVSYFKS